MNYFLCCFPRPKSKYEQITETSVEPLFNTPLSIIVIGDQKVGKTSKLFNFNQKGFIQQICFENSKDYRYQKTIGVDFVFFIK